MIPHMSERRVENFRKWTKCVSVGGWLALIKKLSKCCLKWKICPIKNVLSLWKIGSKQCYVCVNGSFEEKRRWQQYGIYVFHFVVKNLNHVHHPALRRKISPTCEWFPGVFGISAWLSAHMQCRMLLILWLVNSKKKLDVHCNYWS